MESYPLGLRVALSQLAGCAMLTAGVLFGPMDSAARALAVGACAGACAASLAGFRFPGWPWLSGALACATAGLFRGAWGWDVWVNHLTLCMLCLVAYAAIWPTVQGFLAQFFGLGTDRIEYPVDLNRESAPMWLGRGLCTSLAAALLIPLLLLALGSAAQWHAALAAFALAAWLTVALAALQPEWLLSGTLLGCFVLLVCSAPLAALGIVTPVAECDPSWLVGQLMTGSCVGFWWGLWQQAYAPSARRSS